MAIFNIQSRLIRALPVVNRDVEKSNDIYSRHTSEEFLAGIINKFIDRDGFVITSKEDISEVGQFAFNIHGYYFTILHLSDLLYSDLAQQVPEDGSIYAYIDLEKHGVWTELMGSDETYMSGNEGTPEDKTYLYTGVTFTDQLPQVGENKTRFYLELFKRTPKQSDGTPIPEFNWGGTGWYVPSNSYVRFDGPSFLLHVVDGGDMDKLF